MKHRSRTDIAAQILEVATRQTKKTKIMYRAYLSYEMLGEYLSVLKENGLLDCNEVQEYKTTEKGMRFLKAYRQLGQMAVTI